MVYIVIVTMARALVNLHFNDAVSIIYGVCAFYERSRMDREKFEKLAAIINDPFGIADENGNVLYSVPEKLWPDDRLALPAEEPVADFFRKDGFVFYRCVTGSKAAYIFKREDSDAKASERTLKLAAYVVELENGSGTGREAALRRLLTEGPDGADLRELQEQENAARTVMIVFCAGAGAEDDGPVAELLESALPAEDGYETVRLYGGAFAVVCPVKDSDAMTDLAAAGDMIHDTISTELMLKVSVALGGEKKRFTELKSSLDEAMTAAEIGGIFELAGGCFRYDRLGLYRLIYELPVSACVQYLKETLGEEFFADKSGTELLGSLKAFLDNNMNISGASKALYVHRNTMLYRMDKFRRLTGLDPANFDDGMRIKTALLVLKYLEKKYPDELTEMMTFYGRKQRGSTNE